MAICLSLGAYLLSVWVLACFVAWVAIAEPVCALVPVFVGAAAAVVGAVSGGLPVAAGAAAGFAVAWLRRPFVFALADFLAAVVARPFGVLRLVVCAGRRFVAGAAAPLAAFACQSPSVYPDSGAPGPAASVVCPAPAAAS